MAMILEIVEPDGTRRRHRLDTLPLTLGRGLANGIVLDDPYVDGQHARIVIDDTGTIRIEDLGSVNGLVAQGARIQGAVALEPDNEVRIGRTVLRMRDSDAPVAPALVDEQDRPASIPARGRGRGVLPVGTAGWLTMPRLYLLISVAALIAFGLASWFGSSERSSVSTAFGGASAFAVGVALWAGVWAVASRAIVQRFNFVGHVAMASAAALTWLVWGIVEGWFTFFFPDAFLIEIISTVVVVAVICALIAGHLSLSSRMPSAPRWRAGVIVAACMAGAVALAAVLGDEDFTDVASFSDSLKPIAPRWIPTSSVGEFGAVMLELKADVDEVVK